MSLRHLENCRREDPSDATNTVEEEHIHDCFFHDSRGWLSHVLPLVVKIPLRVVHIQAGMACFLFQGESIREEQQAVLERGPHG